jgi:hypothetical protein
MTKGLKMTLKQMAVLQTVKTSLKFLVYFGLLSIIGLAIGPEILMVLMIVMLLVFGVLLVYETNLNKLKREEENK